MGTRGTRGRVEGDEGDEGNDVEKARDDEKGGTRVGGVEDDHIDGEAVQHTPIQRALETIIS